MTPDEARKDYPLKDWTPRDQALYTQGFKDAYDEGYTAGRNDENKRLSESLDEACDWLKRLQEAYDPTDAEDGIAEIERLRKGAAREGRRRTMPKLTDEQITELERGDGTYYVCQERAFAPGIADGWPAFIPAPHTKNGRLVRRIAGNKEKGDD